jgi:multiple sugar transport system permease protein
MVMRSAKGVADAERKSGSRYGSLGLVVPARTTLWRSGHAKREAAALSMATPFLVLFALFVVVPLGYAIVHSLSQPSGKSGTTVSNFSEVIHSGDFWSGVERVLYLGVIQIVIMLGLAMGLALLLDSPLCKGKRMFALIYFVPYAVPGVIATIMWGFILSPQVDSLVHGAGVNPLSLRLVLYSIVLIVLWEFTGYNMTIYLTGLASISPEVLEAARIDGCSNLQLALRIKLPLIRRMIIFTAVLSIIGTLQLFNEPEILSALVPLTPSYTPNLSIYNEAFEFGNIPFAAAESLILGVIIVVATAAFYGLTAARRPRSGP